MIFEYSNYRSFLKDILSGKQDKSPGFSMRAFALKIGLSQSTLSQVLSGKKNLSWESALRIAEKLKFSPIDTEYLALLVRLETAKDPGLREMVWNQIQKMNPDRHAYDLSVDLFRSLSDWYHLAIRNLIDIDGFVLTPASASKRLGISVAQAETAIERLTRLELIEDNPKKPGTFIKVHDRIVLRSQTTNKALRIFHNQMLEKAIEALESQTPDEKIVGSETFAISEKQLSQANLITEEYFCRMAALSGTKSKKTAVYHLGVQFFKITKTKEKNEF